MVYRYQIYDRRSDPRETPSKGSSPLTSTCRQPTRSPAKFVHSQETREWAGTEDAGGFPGRSTKDNPQNRGSSNYGAGDPSVICIHFAFVLPPCCHQLSVAYENVCLLLCGGISYVICPLAASRRERLSERVLNKDLAGVQRWAFPGITRSAPL